MSCHPGQSAVPHHRPVGVDAERKALPVIAGGVLEGDVLRGKSVTENDHTYPLVLRVYLRRVRLVLIQGESDDRRRRIVALKRHVAFCWRQDDLPGIDAGFDVNDGAALAVVGKTLDGFLHRFEIAAAVGGNGQFLHIRWLGSRSIRLRTGRFRMVHDQRRTGGSGDPAIDQRILWSH